MKKVKIRFSNTQLCVIFCAVLEQITSLDGVLTGSSNTLLYALKRYCSLKDEFIQDRVDGLKKAIAVNSSNVRLNQENIYLFQNPHVASNGEIFYIEVLEDENGAFISCDPFYVHLMNIICCLFKIDGRWHYLEERLIVEALKNQYKNKVLVETIGTVEVDSSMIGALKIAE